MVLGYLCLNSFSFLYTSIHGNTPIQGCAKVKRFQRKCFVTCILSFQICYIPRPFTHIPTIYYYKRTLSHLLPIAPCSIHKMPHSHAAFTHLQDESFLLQQYYFSCPIVHVRHGVSNGCPNESWVANYIRHSIQHNIIPFHFFRKAYRCSQMTRIVNKNDLESEQVTYQTGKQDRTVFAVTIRIIQSFFGKESPVMPPYLVVVFIHKSRLHEIQQTFGGIQFCQSFYLSTQSRVKKFLYFCFQRYICIHSPTSHEVAPYFGRRISVVEIKQIFVYVHLYGHVRVAFRCQHSVSCPVVCQTRRLLYL